MLLSTKGLENLTGIDRTTWSLWIRQGRLKSVKVGKKVLVEEAEYNAFIAAHTVKAKEQ